MLVKDGEHRTDGRGGPGEENALHGTIEWPLRNDIVRQVQGLLRESALFEGPLLAQTDAPRDRSVQRHGYIAKKTQVAKRNRNGTTDRDTGRDAEFDLEMEVGKNLVFSPCFLFFLVFINDATWEEFMQIRLVYNTTGMALARVDHRFVTRPGTARGQRSSDDRTIEPNQSGKQRAGLKHTLWFRDAIRDGLLYDGN